MNELRSEVYEAMVELRPFVEARIHEWMEKNPYFRVRDGAPLTTGFCRGIAAGVEEVLKERFPECYWRVAGGYGVEYCDDQPANLGDFADLGFFPGGMVDECGEWNGHFWVVGGDPDSDHCLIIDLSADQFGHAMVEVIDGDDQRYRENCLLGTSGMIRPLERA